MQNSSQFFRERGVPTLFTPSVLRTWFMIILFHIIGRKVKMVQSWATFPRVGKNELRIVGSYWTWPSTIQSLPVELKAGPSTSWRQQRQLLPCSLVIALVPLEMFKYKWLITKGFYCQLILRMIIKQYTPFNLFSNSFFYNHFRNHVFHIKQRIIDNLCHVCYFLVAMANNTPHRHNGMYYA